MLWGLLCKSPKKSMGLEESEAGICLDCLVERSLVPETKTCAGFIWRAQAPEMGSRGQWQRLRAGGAQGQGAPSSQGERLGAELPKLRSLAANHQGGSLGSVHPPCSHLETIPQKSFLLSSALSDGTERMSSYSKWNTFNRGYTQTQTIQEWKVNIFTSYSRTTQSSQQFSEIKTLFRTAKRTGF